ncbi:hypothetical protein V2A60_006694 [Cordyceps javanica]
MSDIYDERSRNSRQTDDSHRHRDRRSRSPHHKRRRLDDADHGEKSTRENRRDENTSSRRHRSPHRDRQHRHRRERDSTTTTATAPVALPFDARPLTRSDLHEFGPLLAHYLDLQKQKYIDDMDDREVRGRWKSFVGKWNRGELAEGWYDPDMFQRILAAAAEEEPEPEPSSRHEPERQDRGRYSPAGEQRPGDDGNADAHDSDDSDYGPTLPLPSSRGGGSRRSMGVGIPSRDDLALRDEARADERDAARADLRAERRAERKRQQERLEELAPRAEAGTRERRLEKRREVNDKMRRFREGGSPGPAAAHDGELMGGGGDDLAEMRRRKAEEQRRKSEREIRREELQRAKQQEMEDRRRRWQEREQGTMTMLQELARQRFGPGS